MIRLKPRGHKYLSHSFAGGTFIVGLCLLLAAESSSAQDAISVDQKTLQQHVLHRVPLFYPPIAKAANIQGTVVLEIRVGTTGKVESLKPVSGSSLLIQAATDTVRQWTYTPFESDGVQVPARGQVSLIFTLGGSPAPHDAPPQGSTSPIPPTTLTMGVPGEDATGQPDEKIATEYFKSWHDCVDGVMAHAKTEATASFCKQAAEIATRFAPNTRYIERRSSAVYAATALANIGNFADALRYANRAVETVLLGNDGNSGASAAYSTRGTVEGYLGDFAAADKDLEISEGYERKEITSMEKDAPSIGVRDKSSLARDLTFHAEVLKRLNRPSEAQAKLDEAAKL
jgi:TonB family protein